MKLINKTRYNSDVMRSIFSECMAHLRRQWALDWPKLNGLRIMVTYARRTHFVSGYAYLSKPVMRLSIPSRWDSKLAHGDRVGYRNGDLAQAVAATFIHELGHNLGVKGHINKCTIEAPHEEWIYAAFSEEKYPLMIAPAKKPAPDARLERFERALANKDRAETRLKRAQTLLRKWSAKVRYYERTLPQAATRKDGK